MIEGIAYIYFTFGLVYAFYAVIRFLMKNPVMIGPLEVWLTAIILFIVACTWPAVLLFEIFVGLEFKRQNELNQNVSDTRNESMETDIIGSDGFALSDFRPSGKFEVAGKLFDGRTKGKILNKVDRIKVVEKEGFQYVVENKQQT